MYMEHYSKLSLLQTLPASQFELGIRSYNEKII